MAIARQAAMGKLIEFLAVSLQNKYHRGKPSRYRSTFSFLENGVLARKFLFIRPKGRGINPQEIQSTCSAPALLLSADKADHQFI